MTLVLTCIAPDFVVQVSDRRTTYPNGTAAEDEFNKALFFCSMAVISFTGLAEVDGESTIAWARERIAGSKDLGVGMEALQAAATRTFVRQPGRSTDHRTAFVLAGFGTFQYSGGITLGRDAPFMTVISNFLDQRGRPSSRSRKRFDQLTIRLNREPFMLYSAGQDLSPEEYRTLRHDVQRVVERDMTGASVARLLALQVLAVAARNDRVGKNLICTIVPRTAVGTGAMQVSTLVIPRGGLPDIDRFRTGDPASATHIYLPADRATRVFHGADTVCEEARFVSLAQEVPTRDGDPYVFRVTAWDTSAE